MSRPAGSGDYSNAAAMLPVGAAEGALENPPDCERDATSEDEPAGNPGAQVLSLLKPVSVTMVLVVYLVHEMQDASQQIQGGFSDLMVYKESNSDSASTILGGVVLNSMVVVFTMFVVTTGLLLLYRWHCYRIIYAWLFFSVATRTQHDSISDRASLAKV